MFATLQGAEGRITQALLSRLAGSLSRGLHRPAIWCDERASVGFVASVAGTLPEDEHDCQPLIDSDIAFSCQVRLDNRTGLLERLEIPRRLWSQTPDSEILFRSYLKWERRCVLEVFGDFAFVAWHRVCGRIVAAVDHFATFPLFYAEHGTELVISPQLRTVLAHPDIPRVLNLVALAALIAPRSLSGATPYRAIRKMPGGHFLIREKGGLRLERWWNAEPARCTRYRDRQDYVAATSALFDQAVETRLRTSGRVAATMSGGLDSTLVSATAARLLAQRGAELTAYTSVPQPGLACVERGGWDSSDFEHASSVAGMYPNMRHVTVTPGDLCPLDLMPATHALSRTPVRNGANHVWLGRISRLAEASGANVILTGQRGNLTISASATFAELLGTRRWRALLRYTAERRALDGRSLLSVAVAVMRARLNRPAHPSVDARRPGLRFLRREFRESVKELCDDEYASLSDRERRLTLLMTNRQAWAADPWVQWGTHWRDPTSDRRMIECLLSYPGDAFLIGGYPRGLARAIGRGRLPDIVRLRRTQGAQMPEHPALIAAHLARYEMSTDSIAQSDTFRSICDIPRLRDAIRELAGGSGSLDQAQTVDRVIDVGLFICAHEGAA